jgi:hypothetical protein
MNNVELKEKAGIRWLCRELQVCGMVKGLERRLGVNVDNIRAIERTVKLSEADGHLNSML